MASILEREALSDLVTVLVAHGYRVIGPTIQQGAIVYDDLRHIKQLPQGITDDQDTGTYRLRELDKPYLFYYTVGPHAWKKFLYPAHFTLWRATYDETLPTIDPPPSEQPLAFIGVRSCDLAAMAIQDRIFMTPPYVAEDYQERRSTNFIVAINCAKAGGTCFCASMNTGPQVISGFDLALTEILDETAHYFVVDVGSERGAEILAQVPHHEASSEAMSQAQAIVDNTRHSMTRHLNTTDLPEMLYTTLNSPHWAEVGERCLACANCTLVCPTCFCASIHDTTDLTGHTLDRVREWDSCFGANFAYIHGGSLRQSTKARYRQWLLHKLATWVDQFDTMGCVGCGRCITWCPVGIDLTAEAEKLRQETLTAKEGE